MMVLAVEVVEKKVVESLVEADLVVIRQWQPRLVRRIHWRQQAGKGPEGGGGGGGRMMSEQRCDQVRPLSEEEGLPLSFPRLVPPTPNRRTEL